jgi:hypothetical protein
MTFEEDLTEEEREEFNKLFFENGTLGSIIKKFQKRAVEDYKSKVGEAIEKLIVYIDYKDIRAVHFESMIYRDIKQRLLGFEKELGLTSKKLVIDEVKVLTPKDKDYKRINAIYEADVKRDKGTSSEELKQR